MITSKSIDDGKAFDFGRTSEDYSKYRDIYPAIFYEKIVNRGLCTQGQKVLDVGTGTGVLPRNMYKYGAEWIGADISKEQIDTAKSMVEKLGYNIDFILSPAEDLKFPKNSFDIITACQCFCYFDYNKIAYNFSKILKPKGKFLVLYMAWLPFEDSIAGASEKLILKYNPYWSGGGETKKEIYIPKEILEYFDLVYHEEYNVKIPFTQESWHGRMRACRGVGASLTKDNLKSWDLEHKKLLKEIAPEKFDILHYVAMSELQAKATPHNLQQKL